MARCPSAARSTFRAAVPTAATAAAAGSIWLVADRNINTLIEYRYARIHRAKRGENGRGADQFGKGAEDIVLQVPVGTVVYDADTGAQIADLAHDGERAIVAKGGRGGLGNLNFKSSTNRAPRQSTPGEHGRGEAPAPRASRARRRRPPRPAERGQVDAHPRRLGGAAQGGRLPVHHARAQPRRGAHGREPQLRHRGHPRD